MKGDFFNLHIVQPIEMYIILDDSRAPAKQSVGPNGVFLERALLSSEGSSRTLGLQKHLHKSQRGLLLSALNQAC